MIAFVCVCIMYFIWSRWFCETIDSHIFFSFSYHSRAWGKRLQQRFVLNRGNIRYIGKKQHGVLRQPRLKVGVRQVRDKAGEVGRGWVTKDIPAFCAFNFVQLGHWRVFKLRKVAILMRLLRVKWSYLCFRKIILGYRLSGTKNKQGNQLTCRDLKWLGRRDRTEK